ncbi:hypothetical protein Lser_V15G35242 [Lactuca serriola]
MKMNVFFLNGWLVIGTGCLFPRIALYGLDPPGSKERHPTFYSWCCTSRKKAKFSTLEENCALRVGDSDEEDMNLSLAPKKFENSTLFIDSIPVAEFQSRQLAVHPPGALTISRELLDTSIVVEAISRISCWGEDKTKLGKRVGRSYGSVMEDVVTGYKMHNMEWKSVYYVIKRDAFRGTAPINLTYRLH